jgi:hypothetical protein
VKSEIAQGFGEKTNGKVTTRKMKRRWEDWIKMDRRDIGRGASELTLLRVGTGGGLF